MRRVVVAGVLSIACLSLTACGGPSFEEELQTACMSSGGVYFEHEDTSAGVHIWCITADGVDIGPSVSEGDR